MQTRGGRLPVVVVMSAVAAAVSCSNGSPPTGPTPPTAIITTIVISGTAPPVGQSAQFTALAALSDGSTRDVTAQASWLSTRPDIATAAPGGTISAIWPGAAEISATMDAVAGRVGITVAFPDQQTAQFARDYIQASFLGSGPLTSLDSPGCPARFRWVGFPRGTQVRVRAGGTVPQAAFNALVAAAAGAASATGGAISAAVESVGDEVPAAGRNEVAVAMHGDPQSLGCPLRQGCTRFMFEGSIVVSATAILFTSQAPAAYVHDAIGHGVLGLCHVDGNLIGGPSLSLMSFGGSITSNLLPLQLTPFDLAATQPVFGSAVPLGSSLQDFVRAGLLGPPVGTLRPPHGMEQIPTRGAIIDAPRLP